MKTINILGETQREQWHSVVNMLRQLGGDLTREGRSELCDELDRYIDAMEDANENSEQKTVYALISKCYTSLDSGFTVDVKLFDTLDAAQDRMFSEYDETLLLWNMSVEEQNEYRRCVFEEYRARIDDYTDFAEWKIEDRKIN